MGIVKWERVETAFLHLFFQHYTPVDDYVD